MILYLLDSHAVYIIKVESKPTIINKFLKQ